MCLKVNTFLFCRYDLYDFIAVMQNDCNKVGQCI
jgi:hypothetical protein